jgi:hypothetical protein
MGRAAATPQTQQKSHKTRANHSSSLVNAYSNGKKKSIQQTEEASLMVDEHCCLHHRRVALCNIDYYVLGVVRVHGRTVSEGGVKREEEQGCVLFYPPTPHNGGLTS